nr:unnamed protein product [Haemonchus contortus]
MCSNDITGFLQRSETTSAHSVVLSCAHVVCDECFKKLGLTSFQAEKRGYVKCVLCRSTVTFTILPTLDDVGPSTSCNSCAQTAGYECKQCCMNVGITCVGMRAVASCVISCFAQNAL